MIFLYIIIGLVFLPLALQGLKIVLKEITSLFKLSLKRAHVFFGTREKLTTIILQVILYILFFAILIPVLAFFDK